MSPTVTICVPAYNAALYLPQALESALAQTFSDFELVLVDNASTDGTFAIAEKYTGWDRRIRLFKNGRNLGSVGNFNRCIDLARGEWIKFLCADDWLEPGCIERFIAKNRRGVLVMTCIENYVCEQGMEESQRRLHSEYWANHCLLLSRHFPGKSFISADEFAALLAEDPTLNSISLNSAMVHRTAFERFGRFNSDLLTLDDWEFFARIALQTGLINLSDVLTNCRIHSGSYGSTTHTRRPFKMDILSPLIIWHEVVYSPVYAKVRTAAAARNVNLQYRLVEFAREARLSAANYAKRPRHPDPHAVADWDETVKRYPRLLSVPVGYYFSKSWQRGKRILRRAKAALIRHSHRASLDKRSPLR